jgi:hypothetical protein
VNDEDFARTLLTRAASGADEPRLGIDIDQMVHDGRRASRTRVAGLATGGTVLAGAVALSAWGLAGLGHQPQGTTVGPGAGSSATKSDSLEQQKLQQQKKDQLSDAPDRVKGANATPCTTTIDLAAVLRSYLPSSTSVTQSTGTVCTLLEGKTRTIETHLQLAHPTGSLAVSLQSGGSLGEDASMSAADKEAKAAIAAKDGDPVPSCTTLADGWHSCVTHLTKAGMKITLVSLSLPGSTAGSVARAVALDGTGPETGGAVPFTDAALVDLAHNVATHTS